jgi:hypothetical protein
MAVVIQLGDQTFSNVLRVGIETFVQLTKVVSFNVVALTIEGRREKSDQLVFEASKTLMGVMGALSEKQKEDIDQSLRMYVPFELGPSER